LDFFAGDQATAFPTPTTIHHFVARDLDATDYVDSGEKSDVRRLTYELVGPSGEDAGLQLDSKTGALSVTAVKKLLAKQSLEVELVVRAWDWGPTSRRYTDQHFYLHPLQHR